MMRSANLSERKRQLLARQLSGAAASEKAMILPRRSGETAPISAEQKNVWLHAAMAPEVPLYNEALTIHRRGRCDVALLARSFREILRRHEIWRTVFRMVDGDLRQIVLPGLPPAIPFDDLTRLQENAREERALALATADAREPFKMSAGPLLRARIVKLSDEEHRLYLALHHIIFDGVSIYRIIVPELAAIYAALEQGRDPGLPPPPLQYSDYALWRERELRSENTARELAYWRSKLAGELPSVALPVHRARSAQTGHQGGMETFQLSAELTSSLKELCRKERVTLYVVLLSAFKALLHRYSGQEDILIGGVTDMRRRPELAGTVGYFLNSFALRTRPTSRTPFREYLREVQDTVVGALDASSVPFDRVVREVQPRRQGGSHPLFQVLFSIEPPPPAIDPGWDLTQMDVTVAVAKFDLYLELDERPEGLIGRFLYNSDLFEAATIRRMIAQWSEILAGAVADPACVLGKLPLTARTRTAAIATVRPYPDVTLPEWFEVQARRTPDAIAVECADRIWSYRDLHQRVRHLTDALENAGSGRERLVAVLLQRGVDMVAGLLAILRSGGAYLPLDPELPDARLAALLDDANPAIVLTQSTLRPRVRAVAAEFVVCDDVPAPVDDCARETPVRCHPDDLAYVLYTSGSTGRPKAVEIRHRSLSNLLRAAGDVIDPGPRDRWLAVTTICFDIAALELFLPLVTGGRVCLATREQSADPRILGALAERTACTIMQATPATWRGLLAAGWRGSRDLKILCGGEALQAELARQLLERGCGVWNMYGPTETTIWSLIHRVRPEDDPVPIGRPLANTSIHVVDPAGQAVPDGVAGELCIGGQGLALGYRNDPVRTREKFCRLSVSPDERLYRTGDRVRIRHDGVLEFLGRTDNQVKIRGFRVGLEEVEAALAGHPDLADAAVLAWPDSSGEMGLVAYVVPRTRNVARAPDVSAYVAQRLPHYMVPSRTVTLDALPMTANGKVDRKRLPAPPREFQRSNSEPRDDLERTLADIWKTLLDLPSLGVHDNFFDLGGHSLMAALLAAEIRKILQRELPLASLFSAPTIAQQAALLRKMEEPSFSHLVLLRSGFGRPLFIVHGVFGNVLQFRGLAERIATDRPIWAIQARGADTRQQPHATIDEMASAYFAEIRRLQPRGPYALAGYSFGGLIAFEIACRLREQGDGIELLALLETDVHSGNLLLSERLAHQIGLAGRVVHKLAVLPVRAWPQYLAAKLAMMWRHLFVRLESVDPIAPGQVLPTEVRRRNCEMYRLCVREFLAYRPRRFAGPVSVFRIAQPVFDMCDPVPLWRRIAQRVEVFTIAGTHGTVMDEPNVDGLSALLGECLARADDIPATPRPSTPRAVRETDRALQGTPEPGFTGEPHFAH